MKRPPINVTNIAVDANVLQNIYHPRAAMLLRAMDRCFEIVRSNLTFDIDFLWERWTDTKTIAFAKQFFHNVSFCDLRKFYEWKIDHLCFFQNL